jgi:hypothetical protein
MRFYTKTHRHYCGIDLHARSMYLCILDREGEVLLHQNMKATPEAFLGAVAPYRDDLVVAVECIFTWYWLADLCAVNRFPRVNEFLSYARLVKAQKSSAGKLLGHSGRKIGNAHLKWAFSEAAVLFLRQNPDGQKFVERLAKKHGKGKALSILSARLGRAVYVMLKRREPFDPARFLAST